ncbi:MAG: cell division protein FtsQ/DivIB [Gammaproteobacteria bacterium]|nr:MAG: cell division protein FtsQ/DivIB [Gammaproteobacteria bacterium]
MKRFRKKVNRRVTPRPVPWRLILGFFLALGLAVGGGKGLRWLLDPHTFPIQKVRIQGTLHHVSREDVRERLAAFLPAGFFSLDMEGIRRALEAHPWVRRAAVRRLWPHTLIVLLSEEVPLARWQDGGLVNVQGQRFFPETSPRGLPVWKGPAGTETVLLGYHLAMEKAMQPLGHGISAIALDERGAVRFRLDNGLEVNLGRQAIMERLRRFVRVYPALRDTVAMERVDMRYSNGFAVKPKG